MKSEAEEAFGAQLGSDGQDGCLTKHVEFTTVGSVLAQLTPGSQLVSQLHPSGVQVCRTKV